MKRTITWKVFRERQERIVKRKIKNANRNIGSRRCRFARLFLILAKRRPIKLTKCMLPLFKLPQKLNVIITGKSSRQDQNVVIPYQDSNQTTMFSQISSREFIKYRGSLELSVAQMRLNAERTHIPAFVREYFLSRRCGIERSSIEAINLWYYKGKRLSTWHYDGHDNFLFVLKGAKTVYLRPPSEVRPPPFNREFKGKSVFNVNNNHLSDEAERQNLGKSVKCVIMRGECLFIPRGWWHCVFSRGSPNIAINIWGNTFTKEIAANEQESMLKQLIFDISEQLGKHTPNWEEMSEAAREQHRRTHFMPYLKDLLF